MSHIVTRLLQCVYTKVLDRAFAQVVPGMASFGNWGGYLGGTSTFHYSTIYLNIYYPPYLVSCSYKAGNQRIVTIADLNGDRGVTVGVQGRTCDL